MLSRIRFTVVPVVALALVAACNSPSSGSAEAPSASASSSASPPPSASSSERVASSAPSGSASSTPPPAPMDKGRGLTAGLVRVAASLPDITDAQRDALYALDERLKPPDPDPVHEEMRGVHDDLLAGVRAGKIDAAKIEAHYAALDKAADARNERETPALNELYALLTPVQRRGLVGIMRKRTASRDEDRKKPPSPDGGPPDDPVKRRLDGMAADLALDPGQKNAVAGLLARVPSPEVARNVERQRLRGILGAFEAEGFDAKKFDLRLVPGKKAHEAVSPHVDLVTRLVAILLPDQRLRLAASLAKQRGPIGGVGSHDADD